MQIPEDRDLDIEMVARGGLIAFIELAWPSVEPARPFKNAWHVGEIAAHLEAVSSGEFRNLIINVPPGCTKSLTTAVFWPSWEWAVVNAARQYIFATYSTSLSRRDAIRMRNLIATNWFQERWPGVNIPHQNTRSATNFLNSEGGRRMSTSIKGSVTGHHADTIVVDDPLKPLDAEGRRAILGTELDGVLDWWGGTMATRQADPAHTRRVIIMQRLNERDLCGHVLESETEEDWVHLRLPMEFESKFPCRTRKIQKLYKSEDDSSPVIEMGGDERTEDDELLWPAHYGRREVDALKNKMGPRCTASQLQQRPTPLGGAIIKEEWIQFWGGPGSTHEKLPDNITEIQVWDMTFKGKPIGGRRRSFVCGQVWGRAGSDLFLIDQERGQWEFVEQLLGLKRLTKRRPRAFKKLIEDAANGAAVVSAAKKHTMGLKLVSTAGGVEARLQACSPLFESGNVWFPHSSIAPWVQINIDEITAFPYGRNDDTVACTSHGLNHLALGADSRYRDAMANIG